MATKALLPNQHDLLHPFYGQQNCCLCKAEQKIDLLTKEVGMLKDMLFNLSSELAAEGISKKVKKQLKKSRINPK